MCECFAHCTMRAFVPTSLLLTVQELEVVSALCPLLTRSISAGADFFSSLRLQTREALDTGPVRV